MTNAIQAIELSRTVWKLALTPALSPGEREKLWQPSWNTTRLGHRAVLEPKPNHATSAIRASELSSTVRNLPLSPGERAGVRASVPLALPRVHQTLRASLPLAFRGADYSGASISGQWMRCPLLQRFENRVADSLALTPQLRVPETQFFDSKSLEEPGSFCVVGLSSRMAVLEPVEFNREPGLLAKKVQKVFSGGMLAPKFVAGESPVPQPPPHEFVGPGGLLPERTGESGIGHGGELRTPVWDFKKGTEVLPLPRLDMCHKSGRWTPSLFWILRKLAGNAQVFEWSIRLRSFETKFPPSVRVGEATIWARISRRFQHRRCPAARLVGKDQTAAGERVGVRGTFGFMVPMHAKNRNEASNEPYPNSPT